MNARIIFHCAAALVLAAAVAAAQSTTDTAPKKPAPRPTANNQQSAQAATFPSFKSMGSAHATALPPAANGGNRKGAQDAPSGVNPPSEAKGSVAAPKPGAKAPSVEYKDPEDMTTRYRPGNNKTSKTNAKPAAATTPSSH